MTLYSHRMLLLLFVHIICAGPRPKREGSPLIKCTKLHLKDKGTASVKGRYEGSHVNIRDGSQGQENT